MNFLPLTFLANGMSMSVHPPLLKERRKGEKGKKAIFANHLFAFFPLPPLPSGTIRARPQTPQGLGHLRHHVRKLLGLSLIHISEPTRLGMISYAVFCLKKQKL